MTLIGSGSLYFDGVADRDVAPPEQARVQGQPPVEFTPNLSQDLHVLSLSVGIKCRHDTAIPQIHELDDDTSDAQTAAFPPALGRTRDTADQEVGPQAAAVMTERRDGPVRGHQEREDVEPFVTGPANQTRSGAGRLLDVPAHAWGGPWPTVHQRGPR